MNIWSIYWPHFLLYRHWRGAEGSVLLSIFERTHLLISRAGVPSCCKGSFLTFTPEFALVFLVIMSFLFLSWVNISPWFEFSFPWWLVYWTHFHLPVCHVYDVFVWEMLVRVLCSVFNWHYRCLAIGWFEILTYQMCGLQILSSTPWVTSSLHVDTTPWSIFAGIMFKKIFAETNGIKFSLNILLVVSRYNSFRVGSVCELVGDKGPILFFCVWSPNGPNHFLKHNHLFSLV